MTPMSAARIAAVVAVLAAAAIVSVTSAQAASFTVTRFDDPVPGACDPADCSLREAVIAANAAAGGDTIGLQPGTYVLTIASTTEGVSAVDATQGDLDVTDSLTIVGGPATIDAGARFNAGTSSLTVTQPGTNDRVLHASAPLATIDLTVTGGSAEEGAGILVDATTLVMTRGGVTGNAATGACCGGGISAIRSDVSLTDAVLSNNAVTRCCGGALYNESSAVVVTRGSIEDNDAYGTCGCGGAIHNWTAPTAGRLATLTLAGVTIARNDARACCGGAIYNESGTPTSVTISGSVLRDNVTSDDCCGGAIYSNAHASVAVADTSFDGNRTAACCGGAIYNEGTLTFDRGAITNGSIVNCCGGGLYSTGSATLTNVTVSGNSAGSEPGQAALPSAGGIYVGGGALSLTHVTIARNSGTSGASGLSNGDVGGGSAGTVTAGRTIVAGNQGAPQCLGAITSNGYNISSDASCPFNAPSDRKSTDPLLAPLADRGGPGMIHELTAGSPAIDAIATGDCPPPATDQRGVARPQDGAPPAGALCDIGAVEMPGAQPATPTPTPPGTPTPTPPGTPTPTPPGTPTPTPTPGTPTPTATPPTTPTATPTSPPTATAAPTASPSPTPTPSPQPDPIDPRCDDPGVICGTDGDDAITGTAGGELIICGDGLDEVKALGGDDVVECGEPDQHADKKIRGGGGDDEITCPGTGFDFVYGGAGNDRILCGGGNDYINGGAGRDRLASTRGSDRIVGGPGGDKISGGAGGDELHGGGKGDSVRGGAGNDEVLGERGRDLLLGGAGRRDRCDTTRRDRARGCELPPPPAARRSGR